MSNTTRTPIDAKRAMSILNSRKTLTVAHVGAQVILAVQGNATFVSIADQQAADTQAGKPAAAQYFDKYIYNLKANSQEAMARPENRKLLTEAMKAEAAGDAVEADKLFNQYLNAVQVSFNQIADRGRKLESGDMVTAVVGEATTKSGHKALVVNDVRYKKPETVEAIKFDITSLLAEEAPEDKEVTADENVTTK